MRTLLLLHIAGSRFGIWEDEIHEAKDDLVIHSLPYNNQCIAGVARLNDRFLSIADLSFCMGYPQIKGDKRTILVMPGEKEIAGFVISGDLEKVSCHPDSTCSIQKIAQSEIVDTCAIYQGELIPVINIVALHQAVQGAEFRLTEQDLQTESFKGKTDEKKLHLVVCSGQTFAIRGSGSEEVFDKPNHLATLSQLPEYVSGLLLYQQEAVPLLSLARRIHISDDDNNIVLPARIGDQFICLLIEEDKGELEKDIACDSLPLLVHSNWLEDAVMVEDEIVPIIDLEVLVLPETESTPELSDTETYQTKTSFEPGIADVEMVELSLIGAKQALPKSEVVDTLEIKALTRIPNVSPMILGVVEHKGKILPVLDLARCYGEVSSVSTKWKMVLVQNGNFKAFVVTDRVFEPHSLESGFQRRLPVNLANQFVYGCYTDRHSDSVILILNVSNIAIYYNSKSSDEMLTIFAKEFDESMDEQQKSKTNVKIKLPKQPKKKKVEKVVKFEKIADVKKVDQTIDDEGSEKDTFEEDGSLIDQNEEEAVVVEESKELDESDTVEKGEEEAGSEDSIAEDAEVDEFDQEAGSEEVEEEDSSEESTINDTEIGEFTDVDRSESKKAIEKLEPKIKVADHEAESVEDTAIDTADKDETEVSQEPVKQPVEEEVEETGIAEPEVIESAPEAEDVEVSVIEAADAIETETSQKPAEGPVEEVEEETDGAEPESIELEDEEIPIIETADKDETEASQEPVDQAAEEVEKESVISTAEFTSKIKDPTRISEDEETDEPTGEESESEADGIEASAIETIDTIETEVSQEPAKEPVKEAEEKTDVTEPESIESGLEAEDEEIPAIEIADAIKTEASQEPVESAIKEVEKETLISEAKFTSNITGLTGIPKTKETGAPAEPKKTEESKKVADFYETKETIEEVQAVTGIVEVQAVEKIEADTKKDVPIVKTIDVGPIRPQAKSSKRKLFLLVAALLAFIIYYYFEPLKQQLESFIYKTEDFEKIEAVESEPQEKIEPEEMAEVEFEPQEKIEPEEMAEVEFEPAIDEITEPIPPVNPPAPDYETIDYVVKKGDYLFRITKTYTGDGYNYPKIQRENQIPNADLIYPDQVIKIKIEKKAE